MRRAALLSLCGFTLLAGVGACEAREIVVFSPAQAGSAGMNALSGSSGVPEIAGTAGSLGGSQDVGGGGAGTSGGSGGDTVDTACQTSDDCDLSWYCEKNGCGRPAGVCLPRPVSDDPTRAPVCGCEDHITYFNDTLRKQAGISGSMDGECKSGAKSCLVDDDCGEDGRCSHRLPGVNACASMPGLGQCWRVPTDCSSTNEKPHFLPCPPQGMPGGPPPACLTTCQAVQSGAPYFPSSQICQ